MSVGAGWLIETKFSPVARSRRQIKRDRILERIAGGDHRLIVVRAAAGFGKSTLLGQWASRVEDGGTAVAWLNLDEDDREADQFVAYLVEAIRRAVARGTAASAEAFASYAGLPARAAAAARCMPRRSAVSSASSEPSFPAMSACSRPGGC